MGWVVGYSADHWLGACLVGMDYTRYSALQSSTVCMPLTYLGWYGVGWLTSMGMLGLRRMSFEHEPVDTLAFHYIFFSGMTPSIRDHKGR